MNETDLSTSFQRALMKADPRLSRFNPLERILMVDEFDDGFHGWQTFFPDYDGEEDYPGRYPPVEPLNQIVRLSRDPATRVDRKLPTGRRSVPMLSSLTSWDVGTYGSWSGTYALKIPTLARANEKGVALKRITCPWRGKFRVEAYFAHKTEPSDFRLGELDIRGFFLSVDVMDLHHIKNQGEVPQRWWPGIRYHNAENGQLVQRWQANFSGAKGVMEALSRKPC